MSDYDGWLYKFDVRNPGNVFLVKKLQVLSYDTLLSMHCEPEDELMICGTPYNYAKILYVDNMQEARQVG